MNLTGRKNLTTKQAPHIHIHIGNFKILCKNPFFIRTPIVCNIGEPTEKSDDVHNVFT